MTILVSVPKNLPKQIIDSQIIERFSHLCEDYCLWSKKKDDQTSNHGIFWLLINLKNYEYVYTRSIKDFLLFYILKFVYSYEINHDFRGIVSEESFLRNGSHIKKWVLKTLEKFSYNKADKLSTVSNNFSKYLIKNYGNRNITVIPCCVSEKVCFLNNDSLYNRDTIKFIYVGSLSKWQNFEKICLLYSSIQDKNTIFTVISKEESKANQILQKYGVKAVVISGDKEFVLNELRASDFGFIVRENSVINTTASPIKFLEYTASGVIPIMSEFVGDYSEEFKDISYVVNLIESNLSLDKLIALKNSKNLHQELYNKTKKNTWENFRSLSNNDFKSQNV
jgi:glycosyltransferase involved in cell wall biosynthesis